MISKQWKSFINIDREEVKRLMDETLTGLGYVYQISRGSPAIMYDGSETVIFKITSPIELKIRIIRAVADPITRFFMGLAGGVRAKPAALIEIHDLSKHNEEKVKDLVSAFLKRLPGDPWNLKEHPMFARSPLLRLRVQRRWMRWTKQ